MALHVIGPSGKVRARFAEFWCSNIEVEQKGFKRYEKVTGNKIKRNKSSTLGLSAWKCVTSIHLYKGHVCITGECFGPDI